VWKESNLVREDEEIKPSEPILGEEIKPGDAKVPDIAQSDVEQKPSD
jgi:hypothetical protein